VLNVTDLDDGIHPETRPNTGSNHVSRSRTSRTLQRADEVQAEDFSTSLSFVLFSGTLRIPISRSPVQDIAARTRPQSDPIRPNLYKFLFGNQQINTNQTAHRLFAANSPILHSNRPPGTYSPLRAPTTSRSIHPLRYLGYLLFFFSGFTLSHGISREIRPCPTEFLQISLQMPWTASRARGNLLLIQERE